MKQISKLFVVALLGLSVAAVAQQQPQPQVAAADPAATVAAVTPPTGLGVQPAPAQLPKLAKKYEGWTVDVVNGAQKGNKVELQITSQENGNVAGTFSAWPRPGLMGNCVFWDRAPLSGTWDGEVLKVTAVHPNSYCGASEMLFRLGEEGRLDRTTSTGKQYFLKPVS